MSRIEDEIDLTWMEEPVRRWDVAGNAAVARSARAAVATGENLTGLEQYRPLLDAGAVGVVQAGSVWGITHFLRVATLALGHDLPISPVGLPRQRPRPRPRQPYRTTSCANCRT